MRLPVPVKFEWNRGNKDKNWEKHQVHYKEIEEVFLNKPIKIYRDIKHSQVEERYAILGETDKGRRLYIIYTIRDSKVRVISARNQNSKERKVYEN